MLQSSTIARAVVLAFACSSCSERVPRSNRCDPEGSRFAAECIPAPPIEAGRRGDVTPGPAESGAPEKDGSARDGPETAEAGRVRDSGPADGAGEAEAGRSLRDSSVPHGESGAPIEGGPSDPHGNAILRLSPRAVLIDDFEAHAGDGGGPPPDCTSSLLPLQGSGGACTPPYGCAAPRANARGNLDRVFCDGGPPGGVPEGNICVSYQPEPALPSAGLLMNATFEVSGSHEGTPYAGISFALEGSRGAFNLRALNLDCLLLVARAVEVCADQSRDDAVLEVAAKDSGDCQTKAKVTRAIGSAWSRVKIPLDHLLSASHCADDKPVDSSLLREVSLAVARQTAGAVRATRMQFALVAFESCSAP